MPVLYGPFSEAVGATEWSTTTDTSGPDAQTDDKVVQLVADVSDMVDGDELEIAFYEKATSSATQYLAEKWTLRGVQSKKTWYSPAFIVTDGWDFTLKAISGTITVNWTVRSAA